MPGSFGGMPIAPIRYLIPPELAYEAVSRGRHYLGRETDPGVRRRLEDLLVHASEPGSRKCGSAIDALMRWEKR